MYRSNKIAVKSAQKTKIDTQLRMFPWKKERKKEKEKELINQ